MAADIASRVLSSIPKKHLLEPAETKIREYVTSTLPKEIQELAKHPELCTYVRESYVSIGNVAIYVKGYAGHDLKSIPQSLILEVRGILTSVQEEKRARLKLQEDLIVNLMACKNLSKAYDVLPELTKYLDYFNVTQPTYQITTTKLANDLKALGYKP